MNNLDWSPLSTQVLMIAIQGDQKSLSGKVDIKVKPEGVFVCYNGKEIMSVDSMHTTGARCAEEFWKRVHELEAEKEKRYGSDDYWLPE